MSLHAKILLALSWMLIAWLHIDRANLERQIKEYREITVRASRDLEKRQEVLATYAQILESVLKD